METATKKGKEKEKERGGKAARDERAEARANPADPPQPQPKDIMLQGRAVQKVTTFTYLRRIMKADASLDAEIMNRIARMESASKRLTYSRKAIALEE
jgi:hypothetical protein